MHDNLILVLLAGGKSQRMGTPKGLLDYHGTCWILEQIARYKHINNPTIYIGLGFDFHKYFEVVPWFKDALESFYNYNGVEVKVVINKHPENGAFSTLQAVLREINILSTVIVQPIDVPLLNKQSLNAIIDGENVIVIPTCDGKNGHPVKLQPKFWQQLLAIESSAKDARLDIQIKQFSSESISYVNITDSSVYQNINTKNKWINYLNFE